MPTQPFRLLEFRVEANTVAPSNLVSPDPNDRRYAGILGFGVHSQFEWKGMETNIGGDLFMTGSQTGIPAFQGWTHRALGDPSDSASYVNQIGDAVYPTISAEIGKSFSLGHGTSVRPYASAMAGLETWARIGGDITIGHFGDGAVMLRDMTTGQRYRAVAGDRVTSYSFTFGGDMAHVFSSVVLPAGGAAVASDTRERLRVGMHWQGTNKAVFYA